MGDDVKERLEEIAKMEDAEALFKMLDYDGSGSLHIDEFCEGILKAQADKPLELLCLMRQCSEILHKSRVHEESLTSQGNEILSTSREILSNSHLQEQRLALQEQRLAALEADVRGIAAALNVAPQDTNVLGPRPLSKPEPEKPQKRRVELSLLI